jgi:exopolyphosphatase/guanosine-5'-triphosphate,3'-diphosphate pyrophosphatase
MALPREDRTLVDKLSAILRVADALDRGHDGRVGIPCFEHSADRLLIHPDTGADVSLERMSLAEKGDLFGEVFGLEPVLV